jgi:hypothetical protein
MKFGKQFEFHKIPEWYTDYVDYVRLKELITLFKKKVKSKNTIYYLFILTGGES